MVQIILLGLLALLLIRLVVVALGATAVGDEGEFVQRFRRIGISAMEQDWQRRKRRLACRNKLIPSHPPNKNKLFHHSCTQASQASLDLIFDVRSSAQGDFWEQSQSRS